MKKLIITTLITLIAAPLFALDNDIDPFSDSGPDTPPFRCKVQADCKSKDTGLPDDYFCEKMVEDRAKQWEKEDYSELIDVLSEYYSVNDFKLSQTDGGKFTVRGATKDLNDKDCNDNDQCKTGFCRIKNKKTKCKQLSGICVCFGLGEDVERGKSCCPGLSKVKGRCLPSWTTWPIPEDKKNTIIFQDTTDGNQIMSELETILNGSATPALENIAMIEELVKDCKAKEELNPAHSLFLQNEIVIRALEYLVEAPNGDDRGGVGFIYNLSTVSNSLRTERSKIAQEFNKQNSEITAELETINSIDLDIKADSAHNAAASGEDSKQYAAGLDRAAGVTYRKLIADYQSVQGDYYKKMASAYHTAANSLISVGNNYWYVNWDKKVDSCRRGNNKKLKRNWCRRYNFIEGRVGRIIDPIIPKGFCFRGKGCDGNTISSSAENNEYRQGFRKRDINPFKEKLEEKMAEYFSNGNAGDVDLIPFFHPENSENPEINKENIIRNNLLKKHLAEVAFDIWQMFGIKVKKGGGTGKNNHPLEYRMMILWNIIERLKENEFYFHKISFLKSNDCKNISTRDNDQLDVTGTTGLQPGETKYKEWKAGQRPQDQLGVKSHFDTENSQDPSKSGSFKLGSSIASNSQNQAGGVTTSSKLGGGSVGTTSSSKQLAAASRRKAIEEKMNQSKDGKLELSRMKALQNMLSTPKNVLRAINRSARSGNGGQNAKASSLSGGLQDITNEKDKNGDKVVSIKFPTTKDPATGLSKEQYYPSKSSDDDSENDSSRTADSGQDEDEQNLENYEVEHNEIVDRPNDSLFKIISNRYLQSWKRVFAKKITP